jgi:hypothetical protein
MTGGLRKARPPSCTAPTPELVKSGSVPYLTFQRYKESGLRKRQNWQPVWDLQRQEDQTDAESARLNAERDQRLTELAQWRPRMW